MNSSNRKSEPPAPLWGKLLRKTQVRIMKSTKEVCCVARGGGGQSPRGLGFLVLFFWLWFLGFILWLGFFGFYFLTWFLSFVFCYLVSLIYILVFSDLVSLFYILCFFRFYSVGFFGFYLVTYFLWLDFFWDLFLFCSWKLDSIKRDTKRIN